MYNCFQDRLWRKNRGDHGSIFLCKGVDLNRNWGFHFAGKYILHTVAIWFSVVFERATRNPKTR